MHGCISIIEATYHWLHFYRLGCWSGLKAIICLSNEVKRRLLRTTMNTTIVFGNYIYQAHLQMVRSSNDGTVYIERPKFMMTSLNILRVTGPLCGEFTGHRWIPLTKTSDAELWCFLWSAPEQTFGQTLETSVIWDAIAVIMTSL